MYNLRSRNIGTAYPELLDMVREEGVINGSRNGKVMMLPAPLMLEIARPTERVLFDPARNANPFFHLMEALWMIAGRNDVEYVTQFNQNMRTYSDDGLTYNAAYGHRWRNHFGYDQIARACDMLSNDPNTRRCVIAMWDGRADLGAKSKDIPCNTTITCRIENGGLDFVITNRSNDLIFGLCGANAVHMSILQEYMAARIGVAVGKWWHMTVNLHVYEQHWPLLMDIAFNPPQYPASMDLVANWHMFDAEVNEFCEMGHDFFFEEPFLQWVAKPMVRAWKAWKGGEYDSAVTITASIESDDWKKASVEWLINAQENRNANIQNK